jgi:hypothetical protein
VLIPGTWRLLRTLIGTRFAGESGKKRVKAGKVLSPQISRRFDNSLLQAAAGMVHNENQKYGTHSGD